MRDHADSVHPGLNPLGFAVLTASRRLGRSPQSALVHALHADKGAVSRAVTQLEQLGLVRRECDPGDRRSQLLEVTESGAAALEASDARARELLHGRLDGWTLGEVQRLRELLTRLNDADITPPATGSGHAEPGGSVA
nr:MarR family transcriptional regulator [Nocardioides sp. zg-DK7169]